MLVVLLKKQISMLKLVDFKTDFNTKVTEIEGKIPDVSSLVKKTDYATEITSIKNDYVTNAALKKIRLLQIVQKY